MKLRYITVGIFALSSLLLLNKLYAAENLEDTFAGMSFTGSMGRGDIAQSEKAKTASKTYLLKIDLPDKRKTLLKGGKWNARLSPTSKPIQSGKVNYELTKNKDNTVNLIIELTSGGLPNIIVLSLTKPDIQIINGQIDPKFLEGFKSGYLFAVQNPQILTRWKQELDQQIAEHESPNTPTYKAMRKQLDESNLGHFSYMHKPFFDKYFDGFIDYVYLQAVSAYTPLSPKGSTNIELKRAP